MAKSLSKLWKSSAGLFLFTACLATVADALPNKPYLLYSNLTTIGSIDLTNNATDVLISGLKAVVTLGVDRVDNKLYYGEHSLGKMYRSDLNGSNIELFLTDVGKVEGVAIDWVARLIYWTSYTSEKIEVATLDGKYRKVLLNTGLEYPRGMALDPEEGFLFWSDWGAKAAIERCTLAGENRTVLAKDNVTWPNGITVDYVNKKIYWIDAYYDTIYSMDYNGGQRTKIFSDKSLDVSQFHGFDLEFINGDIYWSDWRTNAIHGLKLTKPLATIFTNISIPTSRRNKGVMGVVAVDDSRQPAVSNRCGSNNGGCEQFCLLKPNGYKCACAIGSKLAADGKKCEDAFKDEFIMFADGPAAKIHQLQLDSINVEPRPIKFGPEANISRPVALEFDPVEDRVYWTDVTLRIISRAFRNGTSYEQLFAEKVGVADGLTVDLAGRNLYWTSTTYNTIEMSRLDGSYRRILVDTDLDEPRDIIVDPVGGYMYWTDWGIPKIERAFMDGSNRVALVKRSIRWANGLTIDHVYEKLYWVDAYEDTIELYELKTGKRDVLINEKILLFGFWLRTVNRETNHPFGLTLLHKHIYWTDWHSKSVYRAEINTGANITILANELQKPMDIHAYSIKPKQESRITYTFSFPGTGSNFTCIRSRNCPTINEPPSCPTGYNSSRVGRKCGLTCRNIVGYRYRCPCRDWIECAVRQSYAIGCRRYYYTSFKVRECVQVVRPGRCPSNVTEGTLQSCSNDEACPGAEKCCKGRCSKPAFVATHPCQRNNGGCNQLCIPVPGGHRCQCKTGFLYQKGNNTCVKDTRPTTAPTVAPTTPAVGCIAPKPPGNGTSSCNTSSVVAVMSSCKFACDKGFTLKGSSVIFCWPIFGWLSAVPTCVESTLPQFSNCPGNISVGTDSGVSTKTVTWTVPTAKDYEGKYLNVTPKPDIKPPAKFEIGVRSISYRATDDLRQTSTCLFFIKVKDTEPPSFGSTCPGDIVRYIDTQNGQSPPISWVEPTATDNSGESLTMSRTGISPGSRFSVGTATIIYKATDAAGLSATCSFNITVINVCSSVQCGFGAECQKNIKDYQCVCNIVCTQQHQPVCGSDGKTYSNECTLRQAMCSQKKTITVIKNEACSTVDVCSGVRCGFGAKCQVKNTRDYQCVCDIVCTEQDQPVCGSDGKTHSNECSLRQAMCNEQKNILVIKNGACDCELKTTQDFKNSSSISCSLNNNQEECTIICRNGYRVAIQEFLKIRCVQNKWARANKVGEYVPVDNLPMCYKTKDADTSAPKCPPNYELVYRDVCVQCSPGSAYDSNTKKCTECDETKFQDEAGQNSCKACVSPKTSTTTGAESCFFSYNGKAADIVLDTGNSLKIDEDKLRQDLAKSFTDLCSNVKCSFSDAKSRRKRRDSDSLVFTESQVIILSQEFVGDSQTKVVLLVLDPTSTSPVPDKALSTQTLEKLLTEIAKKKELPYNVASVGKHSVDTGKTGSADDGGKSKAPVIAGVIIALLVLSGFGTAVFLYLHKRRQKSQQEPPPVQFTHDAQGGHMDIGHPSPAQLNAGYENPDAIENGIRHGFVNQVYSEVNAPPPYYASSAILGTTGDKPHVYESPDAMAGPLPAKEPLPEDAVVDLIPQKQIDLPDEVSSKEDLPVKFFHKRAEPNHYSMGDGSRPTDGGHVYDTIEGAEASLKLEPPPKYDDAKLQFLREKAASSILPNVPRKKVAAIDANDNKEEASSSSTVQDLKGATKEQSET